MDFNMVNTPDETDSMPIDRTKNPISFEKDLSPACPVYFTILGAIEKIT